MTPSAGRPELRVIHGACADAYGWTWFCSHCAAVPSGAVSPLSRVCRSCGMGVLLETPSGAVPTREDAFLVVDASLTLRALSEHATDFLGVIHEDAVNQPVARFLAAADTEAGRPEDLMGRLALACTDGDGVHSVSVRPRGAFGVRVVARISPCGPPRAALVVLEQWAPRPELRAIQV